MLTSRGLGTVLADLSNMGFNAKWGVVSAADIGANHQRERIWIRAEQRNILSHTEHNEIRRRQQQSESIKKTVGLADTSSARTRENNGRLWEGSCRINRRQTTEVANTENARQPTRIESTQQFKRQSLEKQFRGSCIGSSEWWASEPNVGRVANGLAARVDRLKAIGNGQVPLCAATAWELLR